ncbi:MAG: DUF4955 domain-containing protein [Leeuwenhoekiella sp.]
MTRFKLHIILITFAFSLNSAVCLAQLKQDVVDRQEAPSWRDFCQSLEVSNMEESVLLDYSYAGYHFSEKPLPDVSHRHTISVIDYGAIPNDGAFDDAAIQAAIDAAEASNIPTVVYFPAGKYLVGSIENKDIPIEVNQSHIVLKGAGSGSGGTVIHAVNFGDTSKRWHTPWRLTFRPRDNFEDERPLPLTKVTKKIKRGDKTIKVKNPEGVYPGMWVTLKHEHNPDQDKYLSKVGWNPQWNLIGSRGVEIEEIHLITKVEGKLITFKNPINYNVEKTNQSTALSTFRSIEEIGVEDMLFTSDWKSYPEDFEHHANDIVDYAWRAVFFENIHNGWLRNVKFKDWNDCIQIRKSVAMTVDSVEISGKRGHASFMALGSTGILIKNSVDLVAAINGADGGQRHGPALQSSSTACVYQNIKLQKNQSIDCHGYYPYGNLMDNIQGGTFHQNGGAKSAYPNSGPDLVLWNFRHSSQFESKRFDFWDLNKHEIHTYLQPKFIGFTSPNEEIFFENEGLDELHGAEVYPKSLFNAQLQLRLYGKYASASSDKPGCEAVNLINKIPNDFWSPKGNPVGAYIILDFGKEKMISKFTLRDDNQAIANFKIQYWSKKGWADLNTAPKENGDHLWLTGRSIKTRKLRLIITEVVLGSKVEISEFNAS